MKDMPRKRKNLLDIEIKETKRVAVHFMNGLGNFIQMTPAIQALAKHFKVQKVDLVLDEKWTDSRRTSVLELCKKWSLIHRVYNFQSGFDKNEYVQLFYARHGENCEASTFFKEHSGYNASHVNWRVEKINEVDYYMKEVYKLGYRGGVPEMYPSKEMYRPLSERKKDGRYNRDNEDINYFRVGFCNGYFAGSTWKWERKGWPYFPELARLMKRYFPSIRITLLGKGENEEKWARGVVKVEKEFEGKSTWIYNKVSRQSVIDANNYLHNTDLFVTTDTGLMHIADAQKTPMVVLFGPTLLSKNGPYNKEHRIARSPLQCVPCQGSHYFYACEDWRCMREMKPWMVMQTIRRYIYDLIVKKHDKTIDLDKVELARCKGLKEGMVQNMSFKRADFRRLRGCLRGKAEL